MIWLLGFGLWLSVMGLMVASIGFREHFPAALLIGGSLFMVGASMSSLTAFELWG